MSIHSPYIYIWIAIGSREAVLEAWEIVIDISRWTVVKGLAFKHEAEGLLHRT